MRKLLYPILFLIQVFFLLPSYSQNLLNVGLSTQEMQNGIQLFNQKRYSAAIQAFNLALAYEPYNYAAKYRLGLAYLYSGYAKNAIRIWEELVQLGVADNQVLVQLNNLYNSISQDKGYDFTEPYIFRRYYDGLTEGAHAIMKTSFAYYDPRKDRKYISSLGSQLVVELDSANTIIRKYGNRLFQPNLLKMPMGIAVYSNQVYVADYAQDKIIVFNRDIMSSFAFSFGTKGIQTNQFSGPMGLKFSDDDYLYVVDNGNSRIHKLLPDGTHIQNFGNHYLFRPTDIAIIKDKIYVTDISRTGKGTVHIFDKDGNYINKFGNDFLKEPRGLFVDQDILYISDAVNGIYLYNPDQKTTRAFSANDNKMNYAFDMIKDKDQVLFRTDINSYNIGIYAPLQNVYGNISLDVSQIITDQYPYNYLILRARNKDGSPIIGITPEELVIKEFDTPVHGVLLSGTSKYRSKMMTTILIDRSIGSEQYLPQLEYYLKSFLSNSTASDSVEINLVDNKQISSPRSPANIFKSWNFIEQYQPQSQKVSHWDKYIYDAVTGLFNNLRNRAVIIFTSGESEPDAFSTYGEGIIETYANQNGIPLYVIHFGDANKEFWQEIAEQSYGRYFHASEDATEIVELYNIIKNSPPLDYVVEYQALNYKDIPGLWVDLSISLERLGLQGGYIGGYYVPKPIKTPIELQKSIFGTNL